MKAAEIPSAIALLKQGVQPFRSPAVSQIAYLREERPFRVLISCLLSLRTRDEVTFPASKRLFERAGNVREMAKLEPGEIEKIIFPVGFYRNKARQIPTICKTLLEKYEGKVPEEIDELLTLKGVGRKTANLVVSLGYGKPGICVDTHVHRISNRFGLIQTKDPHQTEFKLREILPRKYWIEYNDLLVTWGQNICKPISPFCSRCIVEKLCCKVGVTTRR